MFSFMTDCSAITYFQNPDMLQPCIIHHPGQKELTMTKAYKSAIQGVLI